MEIGRTQEAGRAPTYENLTVELGYLPLPTHEHKKKRVLVKVTAKENSIYQGLVRWLIGILKDVNCSQIKSYRENDPVIE